MEVSLMLFVHDLESLGRLLIRRILRLLWRCTHTHYPNVGSCHQLPLGVPGRRIFEMLRPVFANFGAHYVHQSVSELLRDVAAHKAGVEARYLQFHPVLNHSVKHCGDLLEAVVCRVKLVGPFFPVVSRLFERISCIDVKDFSGILCLKGLEHRV
jgi:hypothetical protein